jgi:hypothetical protein
MSRQGAGVFDFVDVKVNTPMAAAWRSSGDDQRRIETWRFEIFSIAIWIVAGPRMDEVEVPGDNVTFKGGEELLNGLAMLPTLMRNSSW